MPTLSDSKIAFYNANGFYGTLADCESAFYSSGGSLGFKPPALQSVAGANTYDARTSSYNFKANNTRRFKTALAVARAKTGVFRIACAGDSTTAGFNTVANTEAWPVVLRNIIANKGFTILGTGPVMARPQGNGGAFNEPRWTLTGAWTQLGGNDNAVAQSSAIGNTATFVSDIAGTVVDIVSTSNSGAFTYQIDGGTVTPVTPPGGSTLLKTTISGLANTVHTIIIATTTTTATYVMYIDVHGAGNGVSVGNFGVNGSRTVDWTNTFFAYQYNQLISWAPHVIFLDIGINDMVGSVTIANFKANMQTIITAFQAIADVILVVPTPTQLEDHTLYNQVYYQLADSNNIPLIDLFDKEGTWAIMAAANLNNGVDALHPNNNGYAEIAQTISYALGI